MMTNTLNKILLLAIVLISSACSNELERLNETVILESDWSISSSKELTTTGNEISSKAFDDSNWYKAKVPATVLANLVENGVYKDIFKDKNFEKIDREQFKSSWWYRKSFVINKSEDSNYKLLFEGINYRANIWLNGKQIAFAKDIESPYRIFDFNISEALVEGANVLAVEVFPPAFDDLTIGFVDWNPEPSDRNMGIWRPVKIIKTGKAAIINPVVTTKVNTETLKDAEIKIQTEVKNYSSNDETYNLEVKIEDLVLTKEISLKANSTAIVEFTNDEFNQLNFTNPRLWWPNGLGEASLYNIELELKNNNQISDVNKFRFGIREIEEYINEQGFKGWKVNGQKVLIKGAGWVDDIMLNDDDQKVKDQLAYVKHMNLNTVRLEGFWGKNKTLFNTADELGLLIMVGWSCQWEWEGYCGRPELDTFMSVTTEHDIEVQTKGYADQVTWLRNHPSVFLWVYGSDKLPITELEIELNKSILALDQTRPILASCKEQTSEVSGDSRVKMRGPYGYVTPNYWYIDDQFGGAFGFNTETGPGPQIPPIESIRKMISEDKLWPMAEEWEYHLGRNEFKSLDRYMRAFNARYGESNSIEDFAKYSQISNYEAIRPMFEAFAVNKPKSTGVIQWMLNSAWPEMFWQLYDYYLMPNGSFYGTKKASQTINAIFNYKDNGIYLTNEHFQTIENTTLEVKVFDINSKLLLNKSITSDIAANSSQKAFDIPQLKELAPTYFVHLRLYSSDKSELVNQLYWLTTEEETFDWSKTYFVYTPNDKFGDLKGLRNLGDNNVEKKISYQDEGDQTIVTVELQNKDDKIAFFIEMQLNNKENNQSILPVFWDDNYVSLLPQESRTYTAKISKTEHSKLEVLFN